MSSDCERLRVSIAEKRRQLEDIESANLFPFGRSVNAAALAVQALRRQIAVYERLLAERN